MNFTKPLVELFVKPSPSYRDEKGPCQICHKWFMMLFCLVEKGLIDLRVTPVNFECPPESYQHLDAARQLPVMLVQRGKKDDVSLDNVIAYSTEDLENFIEDFKDPYLISSRNSREVREAEKSFEGLSTNLMNCLKNGKEQPLITTLFRLNDFLKCRNDPYILGKQLTFPDCQLMPKLQHVRVASRTYKQIDIPSELVCLWKYIENMYKTPAFLYSCPTDRDILMHFNERIPLDKDFKPSLMGQERMGVDPEFPFSNGDVYKG
ncbi:unnamed protein product [Protopolystoma xenopodis]|uniref:CLIC N-terminal domain-containing protein n=1 Tax=Protopolystoma xenopodis TaxID=117903 RepID=A0A448X367_9PLAT|nr:unnamed protein product [Protopolystoma xenopodis]